MSGTDRTAPDPGLMHAAAEVARIAGEVAVRHFDRAIEVERKADGTPVTAADRGAERAAREWIERRFPADGILGEEFGAVRPDAPRRWLLDPIDGTKSFVHGVPFWGTLVAVVEGDVVLAGAAEFAALGQSLVAAPGLGCWWNGARCHVSDVATLADATALTTDERFPGEPAKRAGWERLVARTGLSRSWGDCYGYLLVATGRAEAMLDPVLHLWDSACLQPIITEAGGRFTSWEGKETASGGSAVATNARVAAEVRALLEA